LRDIGDAVPAQLASSGAVHRPDVLAGEEDAAAGDGAGRPRIGEGGKADRRFARPRFTDQAEHLAAMEREVDALDQRLDLAVLGGGDDPQSSHAQDLVAHVPSPWARP
jgi:hypothetical protein